MIQKRTIRALTLAALTGLAVPSTQAGEGDCMPIGGLGMANFVPQSGGSPGGPGTHPQLE